MSERRDRINDKVENILYDILLNARSDKILHERYLHHYFSFKYQKQFPNVNVLCEDGVHEQEESLHPEWPTCKKATGIKAGRYVKDRPESEVGSSGHIDFAVGSYLKPWLGIEFKLGSGWQTKAVRFDLVKLMDPLNPFEKTVSFTLLIRDRLSGAHTAVERAILETYRQAVEAVKKVGGTNGARAIWYVVAEVAPEGRRIFERRATPNSFRKCEVRNQTVCTREDLAWKDII